MKHAESRFSLQRIILYAFGAVMVIWIGLLTAPSLENCFAGLVSDFGNLMADPFHIVWCQNTLKTV
ncbi:MAG: type IV secretory system conjugative DNA transfer family protein, partial [Parasporobacterium sp.]|nr:type IV secretory system conjugative DNA transfer family protein [Parasporobacterium sp.]